MVNSSTLVFPIQAALSARETVCRLVTRLSVFAFVAGILVGVGSLTLFPATAEAQDPGSQRGIRTKGWTIWPTFFLETRHDTNIFRLADDEPQSVRSDITGPVSATYLRLRPGVSMTNRGNKTVAIGAGLLGDFRAYLAGDDNVKEQGAAGGQGRINVDLFPRGVFKLGVFDNFTRELAQPNFSAPRSLDYFRNQAGARLSIRPGGTPERRPLSFTLSYANDIQRFDEFSRGDTTSHDIFFRGVWLFFPKTALVVDASMKNKGYVETHPQNIDSGALRVTAGLEGLVTKKLAVLLSAGFGNSNHDEGDSFSGAIGEAALTYTPMAGLMGSLAYRRDYVISFLGNYYRLDEVSLNANTTLIQRLNLMGSIAYTRAKFGPFDPADLAPGADVDVNEERADDVLRANVGASIHIYRFVGLSLGYILENTDSNYQLRVGDRLTDDASYTRHVVYGSIDLRY